MQPTEGKTVRDDRLAEWVRVREDVGGIEQLFVPEAADCTVLAVRLKHPLAKRLLM